MRRGSAPYLSWRHRIPITLAWSTPGAALLATQGYVTGGWPAAIGAFMVTGALLVVTGLWGRLGKLVAAIPVSIAQAMLAGVLLPLCVAPFRALAVDPWLVAPVIVTWVVLMAFAKRWATPAAFGLALVLILVSVGRDGALTWAAPALSFTSPTLTFAAIVSIAVPLYVVTMASQNVPGAAVMASAGYTIPWRESLLITGAATMAGAPAGGHAVNLAAITAALPASPEADPDPARRWIASSATGWGYVVLAPAVAALTVLVAAAPPGLVEAVAGLAPARHLGHRARGSAETRTRPTALRDHLCGVRERTGAWRSGVRVLGARCRARGSAADGPRRWQTPGVGFHHGR